MNEYPDETKEKDAVVQAVNKIIDSPDKRWGRIEHNGSVIALQSEDAAMSGKSAFEFTRQSEESAEKYQYIVDKVIELTNALGVEKPKIVDAGSGPGILTIKIAQAIPNAEVTCLDVSLDMVNNARKRIAHACLQKRVSIFQFDAVKPPENLRNNFDLVVSRNMLHREQNIEQGLLAFCQMAKEGGIVYVVAFINPENFSLKGLEKFAKGIKERETMPDLQRAWTLAYLNAPTFEQYKRAMQNVAERLKVDNASLEIDEERNYVNIIIRKSR